MVNDPEIDPALEIMLGDKIRPRFPETICEEPIPVGNFLELVGLDGVQITDESGPSEVNAFDEIPVFLDGHTVGS